MKYGQIILRINSYLEKLGIALFAIMVFVCFLQIICRYFFMHTLDWPEEAMRFSFIWMSYIGMCAAIERDSHLKVDILSNILSGRAWKIVETLNDIIGIAFLAYVLWESSIMLIYVQESGEVALTLDIPLVLVWAAIPVCFAIGLLLYIARFAARLGSWGEGEPPQGGSRAEAIVREYESAIPEIDAPGLGIEAERGKDR